MRGAGVLATARKHLQIQYAVAAILPAPLGAVCQVGKLENQRLQLVVPSAAHAAKMRQLAPRIAQALSDQGWNLNEIAVKVQAGLPKPGARQALHDTLRPGPLADAVAKLLKHHKSS